MSVCQHIRLAVDREVTLFNMHQIRSICLDCGEDWVGVSSVLNNTGPRYVCTGKDVLSYERVDPDETSDKRDS
jgi:hypothetical protein